MNRFMQAAQRKVNQFLEDIPGAALDDADLFYEEVYTLAHDGAVDAGATAEQAQLIAQKVSSRY